MQRRDFYWFLVLTVLFEAVTCFFRFGLDLQSTKDTGFLKTLTFGLRIHHGYVGVVMVGIAYLMPTTSRFRSWLLRIGAALIVSDLVHHFLVLWPITGDPHFDLVYPS